MQYFCISKTIKLHLRILFKQKSMTAQKFDSVKLMIDVIKFRSRIEIKERRFLSYKEIAEMIGIKHSVLSRTLHGLTKPDKSTLEKICNIIGTKITDYYENLNK
jgi:transcriptional regulator with XRE-family HTH domain